MHLSIIITTYNDSKYLNKAIKSILTQTYLPFEIIVIDDGSKNNNAHELINKCFSESIIPIKFYKQENKGPSSARNLGIDKARGELISFLDVDDYLLDINVEQKLNILKGLDKKKYFGVYDSTIINNKKNVYSNIDFNGLPQVDLIGRKNGIPSGVFSYIFFKDKLVEIGGFDELLKHNEDFDLLIRGIKKGFLFKGISLSGYVKNNRKDSWSRKNDFKNTYENIENFLEKAKNNNYFSKIELNKRLKENRIYLAKNVLIKNKQFYQGLLLLKRAFSYHGPKNAMEFFAFIFLKILFFNKS